MSKSDDMFLDNLDEFVNDENLLITYKRLSLLLKVHVNHAKQMLYAFVNHQRNNKDNDQLYVTYFVAGLSHPINGVCPLKCMIVPEENLEAFKSTLSVITSSHIYSVGKIKVKDEHDIYSAEYESIQKDGIFNSNIYSSIKYPKAKVCSEAEIKSLREKSESTKPKQVNGSCKPEKENGHITHKPVKPQKVTGIAGMFANQTKKTDNKIIENDNKVDEKKSAKDSSNSKKGGVMAFFSKQTGKSNAKPSEPAKTVTPTEEPVEKELSPPPSPFNRQSAGKSKGKRSKPAEDSEDDSQRKRKRIKAAIIDSSSEEEMDYESPIPSPVREPSSEPESPIPKEVKGKSPAKVSPEKSTDTMERKRRRRRKLVPKTFMDEDGYMVTEKVWESESTDVSETEAPPKKPQQTKPTSPQKKKTPPKKKSSPSAKAGKQAALTSFFKKK